MPRRRIRVLITAGPTREYLDPVRYISNESSGLMGFALAEAAADLGCDVILVAGPVSLEAPHGVKRVDVVTAREMHREVMRFAPKSDVIVMAAAVADWRPARVSREKIRKTHERMLELVENPDILEELGRRKRPGQTLVGFALETGGVERHAREKMRAKRCDWIVANHARAIGAPSSNAILISRKGKRVALPKLLKEDLAVMILTEVI
jgi:phosphopantothenoylcysteine decarboxylase/phosphopantothenate--cysteine ligase